MEAPTCEADRIAGAHRTGWGSGRGCRVSGGVHSLSPEPFRRTPSCPGPWLVRGLFPPPRYSSRAPREPGPPTFAQAVPVPRCALPCNPRRSFWKKTFKTGKSTTPIEPTFAGGIADGGGIQRDPRCVKSLIEPSYNTANTKGKGQNMERFTNLRVILAQGPC